MTAILALCKKCCRRCVHGFGSGRSFRDIGVTFVPPVFEGGRRMEKTHTHCISGLGKLGLCERTRVGGREIISGKSSFLSRRLRPPQREESALLCPPGFLASLLEWPWAREEREREEKLVPGFTQKNVLYKKYCVQMDASSSSVVADAGVSVPT